MEVSLPALKLEWRVGSLYMDSVEVSYMSQRGANPERFALRFENNKMGR
jgi:hypothetical protein